MSLEVRLESLKQKHGQIEEQIEKATLSPSTDDLLIVDLKRRKLRLKDEIERLSASRH